MVSDRVYRKGRNEQEACEELRRCAGTQFDPELVEEFIQMVSNRHDLRDARTRGVSKKAAGSIGQQIERLVTALDSRDIAGLQTLAGRLKSSARKYGVSEVAEKAAHLEDALEANQDVIEVLKTANELVDLCRRTQHAYLGGVADGVSAGPLVNPDASRDVPNSV
jgi:HPt (histidine-containing phosphotransfer) domain-containing protein